MTAIRICIPVLALAAVLCARPVNAAEILTFDDISAVHGTVISGQYFGSKGVTISVTNPNQSFNIGVAFDSTVSPGSTSDPDLTGPPWSNNNSTQLGNLLIIQENNTGIGDGIADNPDDQAGGNPGFFEFEFAESIDAFGFDLIDVENGEVAGGKVVFFNGANAVGTVQFSDLGLTTGNNSLNVVSPINGANANLSSDTFTRVQIHLGGSGAVDNIVFRNSDPGPIGEIPEPATIFIWSLLAIVLIVAGRRKLAFA